MISPEVSFRTVVRVNMEHGVFTVILGRLTVASNSISLYSGYSNLRAEERRRIKDRFRKSIVYHTLTG